MQVMTIYNLNASNAQHNIQSLLLGLDNFIDIALPAGGTVTGKLRELEVLDPPHMVRLTVEIDDRYETLFYVNHDASDVSLIHKPKERQPW